MEPFYFNYKTSFLFTVGPTSVTILNKKDPVSSGKEIDVRCQTVGARPPPTITWWLGGKQVLIVKLHINSYLILCRI